MRITDRKVIQEAVGIVIIEMIIIGRMVIIDITEMIHTQEIIEDLVTTEAETAHTREDLRTDLGSIREIHLDHHGADKATLNHPETGIKGPIPVDEMTEAETKDLTPVKERAEATIADPSLVTEMVEASKTDHTHTGEITEEGLKDPVPKDVIGDIETKDLSLKKEEAGIEVGKTVETIIGGQKIADLPTETMKEMEGMREDTLQDLHRLHHIEIGTQKSLL